MLRLTTIQLAIMLSDGFIEQYKRSRIKRREVRFLEERIIELEDSIETAPHNYRYILKDKHCELTKRLVELK